MGYLIRGGSGPKRANPINRFSSGLYRPVIDSSPAPAVAGDRVGRALVLGVTALPWRRLGSEFMPPLHEGSILFMPTTVPGVSIAQARRDHALPGQRAGLLPGGRDGARQGRSRRHGHRSGAARHVRDDDHPEARGRVASRDDLRPAGRRDGPRRPAARASPTPGRCRSRAGSTCWRPAIRTAVGIKIFGPDLDTLQALGEQVERIMQDVPGTRSAFAERGVSGYYVDIDIDRAEAARYGLNVGDDPRRASWPRWAA